VHEPLHSHLEIHNHVITSAKISSKHGAATFGFKAIGFAAGFRCALVTRGKDHKQGQAHFSTCTSPKTYTHLKPGTYVFEVGVLSAPSHGSPTSKSFKIS